jgi:hypothetical protein
MNTKLKLVLLSGLVLLTSVMCAMTSPRVSKSTPDTAVEGQTKVEIPTTDASTPVPSTPQASAAQTGGIAGTLNYPSEGIPPLRIVAFNINNSDWYSVEVTNNNVFVVKDVPAGQYQVVAYLLDKSNDLAGGYTKFVLCGMSVECTDHTLVEVTVEAGQVTNGVQLSDWYAPAGAFPKDPTIQ